MRTAGGEQVGPRVHQPQPNAQRNGQDKVYPHEAPALLLVLNLFLLTVIKLQAGRKPQRLVLILWL